jgi:hypothetical protein
MRLRHPVRFSLALIVVCSLIAGANPVPVVAASTTYHVSTTGTDTGGCGSEAMPCRTLQYAVNLAQSGDILKVAAGTYTRSSSPPSTDCSVGSANADPVVCFINKHLTMVGGYSPGNWSISNPTANPTIIDGQNSHRGVSVIGWSSASATTSLTMEGFTIRQGLALGATSGEDWVIGGYGGGLYATNAPVTLRHIIFESNRAVGGNTGQAYGGTAAGGALGLNGMPVGTLCILEDVTFSGNQALGGQGSERGGTAIGGGLYVDTANMHAGDLGFFNNVAHAGSSAGSGRDSIYSWTADGLGGGAAIHISTDAVLERVTASGNQAVGGDAGVQAGAGHGGALYSEQAVLTVEKADLRQNKAIGGNAVNGYVGGGGALMASESTISLKQSTIIANEAWGGNGTTGMTGAAGGGGLYLIRLSSQPSTVTISNSIIADNLATEGQGAQVSGGGGGGLWLQGVNADFTHTTIARNRLGETLVLGAGAILVNFSCAQPTVADMNYSIIEGHSDATAAALHVWEGSTLNLYRSLFAANTRDTNAGASSVFPPGTITGMSTCLEAGSADFVAPGGPNYNYHLLDSSVAIDQAVGSTTPLDIDGDARPADAAADIGADEAMLVGLVLGVRRPESGTLALSWQLTPSLLARLDHYELVVTAEAGASPPNEGRLGSPIDVGQRTEFTLTGLTDGKEYRMQLIAYDGADSSLADTATTATPMTLSHTFLPITLGK